MATTTVREERGLRHDRKKKLFHSQFCNFTINLLKLNFGWSSFHPFPLHRHHRSKQPSHQQCHVHVAAKRQQRQNRRPLLVLVVVVDGIVHLIAGGREIKIKNEKVPKHTTTKNRPLLPRPPAPTDWFGPIFQLYPLRNEKTCCHSQFSRCCFLCCIDSMLN